MSSRQAAFRAAYRAQIAPAYDGLAHVALIFAIGGATLWYAAQHIHSPTWLEWLVVPVTAVLANVFEWFLHAQIMHRPRKGFFLAMATAGAYAVTLVWSANAAWLLVCTGAGMYMNYEFFHWCCHVRDDRIVKHIPFVNTIRRHHIAHHDTAIMMHKNMNLTYPFANWLFGTSDLDRGLLGHLFNGYNTRFVRRNLPKVRSSADVTPPAPAAVTAAAGD